MFSINKYARDKIKAKMANRQMISMFSAVGSLNRICQQSKNKNKASFSPWMTKLMENRNLQNDFLDRVYNEFFHELLKGEKGHGK